MTEEEFDWRLVSHDNLCTHCVYSYPEAVGFLCSILRGKRCKALVTKCEQYRPNADERMRLRGLAATDREFEEGRPQWPK